MSVSCKYCASTKIHRSHRYGVDYVAGALFGYFPYRCSQCNRRFRAKRESSPADETRAAAAPERSEAHHSERRSHRHSKPPAKKQSKRTFLREILLYGLALAAFVGFLRWLSEDHSAQPPQP
jgi:hypothetical protein